MTYAKLNPHERTLMGPGPSNIHPRVFQAMIAPIVGHLDPDYLAVMNDIQELLRYVFQTENKMTISISGTGSAGMETCLCNLLEAGDRAVICIKGYFGGRMLDITKRCGAEPIVVEQEWGKPIDPEDVKGAAQGSGAKLIAIVHAETSTGVLQPLGEISQIAADNDALLVVDAVTSLGGCELKIDELGIDAAYSGTQKCVGCPPGLSPVTFNDRAMNAIKSRKSKVQTLYLDMTWLEKYWTEERLYHHTAPISLHYALREALILIEEEGLENRFARHIRNHKALVRGLEAMGLQMLVEDSYRLPTLNTVRIPDGVDDAVVRSFLLNEYNLEIGGGLGELKGKMWRVGLMGYTSDPKNVLYFLCALEDALKRQGYKVPEGAGSAAASSNLN